MVVSLDPTEEQYWTLKIVLCQDLFSMIHDKAKKTHQIHSSFHAKHFNELQQLHIWPTLVLLLIICVRNTMWKSQPLGVYPIILTQWMQKEILSPLILRVFLNWINLDHT